MKQKISLVLSSGSARGIAHVGVIEELERQGYEIASIAGSSIGALVGGIFASGKLKVFHEWLCKLDKKAIFNLADFTLSANGIVKGEKVFEELLKMIPDVNIEDLPIPFRAIATDLTNGNEIVFEGGSLFEAIRASISIPTVLKPYQYNDIILIDGGVLNPIPINRVKRCTNDILVAVDVSAPYAHKIGSSSPESAQEDVGKLKDCSIIKENGYRFLHNYSSKQLNYFTILSQSTSLMTKQISALALALYPPDILIEVPMKSYESYDFYKSKEIIKVGEIATKNAILAFQAKNIHKSD